jgi:hypothetical protein
MMCGIPHRRAHTAIRHVAGYVLPERQTRRGVLRLTLFEMLACRCDVVDEPMRYGQTVGPIGIDHENHQ